MSCKNKNCSCGEDKEMITKEEDKLTKELEACYAKIERVKTKGYFIALLTFIIGCTTTIILGG